MTIWRSSCGRLLNHFSHDAPLEIQLDDQSQCEPTYFGSFFHIPAQKVCPEQFQLDPHDHMALKLRSSPDSLFSRCPSWNSVGWPVIMWTNIFWVILSYLSSKSLSRAVSSWPSWPYGAQVEVVSWFTFKSVQDLPRLAWGGSEVGLAHETFTGTASTSAYINLARKHRQKMILTHLDYLQSVWTQVYMLSSTPRCRISWLFRHGVK